MTEVAGATRIDPAVSRETGAPASLVSRETTAAADTPIAAAAAAAVQFRRNRRQHQFPRPPKPRLIAVANQKGGVGKTTSAVNLAAALSLHGLRVLVVDLDPQGNASTALGVEADRRSPGTYDVILGDAALDEVILPSGDVEGLFCVPASIDLAGAEVELVDQERREFRLAQALSELRQPVDYVLVDCPPSLGLLTLNALCAAREVLIPIQCEYYALEGLGQLTRNVELVATHLNPGLVISTILLTMYDGRTRLAEQVVEEVRAHFGPAVLSTTVPRSVRVAEAPSYGRSVVTHDPLSRGARAYLDAARELAEAVSPRRAGSASADQRDDNERLELVPNDEGAGSA
jgi:chromosome partitioning protein